MSVGSQPYAGLPAEVLQQAHVEWLRSSLQGDDAVSRQEALRIVLRCFRDPAALAASFQWGDSGSLDFSGVATLCDTASRPEDRQQLMEALSMALRNSQPCTLEQASTLTTLKIDQGEFLCISSMGMGGGSAVRYAWYGPRDKERSREGVVVTRHVVERLGQVSHFEVCDSALMVSEPVASSDEGTPKVLIVDIAVQTETSAVVLRPCLDEVGVHAPGPPVAWLAVALAAGLPMLAGSLPKDDHGVSMLPHPHEMILCEAEAGSRHSRGGREVWLTNKICDRCMDPIYDRTYYHCALTCDVDFCYRCNEELNGVLKEFFRNSDETGESRGYKSQTMYWTVHVVDEVAMQILNRSQNERMALAQLFATEWPIELFQTLVDVVVDVCNAKLLYNCNSGALATRVERMETMSGGSEYQMHVTPLYLDESYHFWYDIALLQFLYECSGLQQQEQMLDGHEERGHRVSIARFILEGINKCSPHVEWTQWERTSQIASSPDVLRVLRFDCSSAFRLLAAHNNLLPISFRRQCLVIDLHNQMKKVQELAGGGERLELLTLEVDREPSAMIEDLCKAFAPVISQRPGEEGNFGGHLMRRLDVSFKGEAYKTGAAARGPGVRREFFQVALRNFLDAFFVPTGNRSFWFGEVTRRQAFFACGVLLAQVLLHAELIPKVFPWTLYDLLLRDLGSPRASKKLTLQHLAAVSAEEANSIGKVQEYAGEDIAELFGDLGWERVPELKDRVLTQATKDEFVEAYIKWSLGLKIENCYRPFSNGFLALLGSSTMVRQMVDAKQLERIVCGGEAPVDIAAIRRFAVTQHWRESDDEYLEAFWSVLAELPEAAKLQFIMFVTGSDRMPLRGWEELRVQVQKNGTGDDRFATAYTCFSLLLLPKYSSIEVLRTRLLAAIRDSQGFGLQ